MKSCEWCRGYGDINGTRCETCQGLGRVIDTKDYAWILWTILIAGLLILAGLWLTRQIGPS